MRTRATSCGSLAADSLSFALGGPKRSILGEHGGNGRGNMSKQSSRIIEGPKLAAQIPALTVPELIRRAARTAPAKTAIIDATSGRRESYGELEQKIARMAAGLAALGLRPGDALLLFMPNQPEWLIAGLGALAAGAVLSGANFHYGATELAHQLHAVEARFVATTPALLPTVRQAAGPHSRLTILLTGEAPGTVNLDSLLTGEAPDCSVATSPDARAALPFSSGTSGLPKGVILTHRTLVANITQIRAAQPPPESLVWLAYLPMFHIYGFTFSLYCLAVGGTLITLPRFEPGTFLEAIERYQVTHLSTVPPVLQFLAAHPLVGSRDLSSLVSIGCGAAPLGMATEQAAARRLNCKVEQGYGMTEASAVISMTYTDRPRLGSCGQLIPATEARIIDPSTQADVERGASGELWFRGPQAFVGYLNDPAGTARTITAEGWVRTGDVGHFDADGYLYITDRLKELIKVKGFQVAPAELEALLLTHPAVLDAAVIARAHERSGEVPIAFIVAREPLAAQAIKDWVAQRMVDYKHLDDVVFCDRIPKSAAGKILRRELRARDAERAASPKV